LRGPSSVWHVAREYAGLAEAGGVKDVVRGLAEALARSGVPTTAVIPLYGFFPPALDRGQKIAEFSLSLPDQDRQNEFFSEPVRVFSSDLSGVRLLLVESPRYSALRDVYTYTAADETDNHWRKKGTGHWDSHQLNIILQRAALETALRIGERPAVYHCHDGHTSFLPALMREDAAYRAWFRGTTAVVTIHNAGKGYHQDVWSREFARLLTGLPDQVLEKGMLAGAVDPLLLAGSYASLVTVSEQYARELLSEEKDEMSGGLGKALRERGIPLEGITNGLDPAPWDPRHPARAGLPSAFDPSSGDLQGKRVCRKVLAQKLGMLARADGLPLYAFVGRLTGQKGVDVLFHAMKEILPRESSPMFVVLGTGEKEKEDMISWLAAREDSGGRLAFVPRYDPPFAQLIYAASDFFLVPSAYEPCGLTDFIAQILGSIPVVHRVGGLVKIRDGETGFSYREQTPDALRAAIERTAGLTRIDPGLLERIRRTAFSEIFARHTWDRVLADGYLPFYERAAATWTRK